MTVRCVGSEFSHNVQKLSPGLNSVTRRHMDCTWQSDLTHVVECRTSRHTRRLHQPTCRTVHCISHHMPTTHCVSHGTLHFSHLTRRSSGCYFSFVFWVQVLISNRICWLRVSRLSQVFQAKDTGLTHLGLRRLPFNFLCSYLVRNYPTFEALNWHIDSVRSIVHAEENWLI